MNMTETTIATLIALVLTGTTLFIGSKVSAQVAEHTHFIGTAASPDMKADALEGLAREQLDRRQQLVEQVR